MKFWNQRDLEEAYEQIRTPILVVRKPGGFIVSANSCAEDLTGRSKETLINRPLQDLVHGKDRERIAAAIDTAVQIKNATESDVTILRQSGREIFAEINFNTMDEVDDLAIISLHDITQIKLFSAKIELAKEYVDNIFYNLSDIVVIMDTKGIIREINTAGLRRFGMSRQELLGKFFFDLVENGAVASTKIFRVLKKTKRINTYPLLLRTTSQNHIDALLSGSVIESPVDNTHQAVLVISDITNLRKAQDERERALKMVAQTSKLAAVGQLSAGVAHELNNPLAILQGLTENIELFLQEDPLPVDELRSQIHPMLNAIDRMAKIIASMKSMSHSVRSEFQFHNLRKIIEEVSFLVEHQVKTQSIEFIVDVNPSVMIECDPSKVQQIVLNVLSNALHALRENSRNPKIKIASVLYERKSSLDLTIWNNGGPIPTEVQDRLFDPFFTTRRIGEGQGLGLSVAYDIMRDHGGIIEVTSSETDGTAFTLHFPRARMALKVA